MAVCTFDNPDDKAAFIARLEAAGIGFRNYNMPRMLRTYVSVAETEAADDGLLKTCEPDDDPVTAAGAVSADLTVGSDLTGANWGLLSIINRENPFGAQTVFPHTGTYSVSKDGTGCDLYIFDSGVRTGHDEFGGRATNVYEDISSGGAGDDNGHGTACASLAAGSTIGPARGASIRSFKCLNSSLAGTLANLTDCIDEAVTDYNSRQNPSVASMSIVSTSSGFGTACADLISIGIPVCAAVGNAGSDLASVSAFPAEGDDVIAAAGHNAGDGHYAFGTGSTNYGDRVDVVAPAQQTYAANNGSDSQYSLWTGTSMAAPVTAGVILCHLEDYDRPTTTTQVQNIRSFIKAQASERKNTSINLPDRWLYLDPDPEDLTITGLTKSSPFKLSIRKGSYSTTMGAATFRKLPQATGNAGEGTLIIAASG